MSNVVEVKFNQVEREEVEEDDDPNLVYEVSFDGPGVAGEVIDVPGNDMTVRESIKLALEEYFGGDDQILGIGEVVEVNIRVHCAIDN